MNRLYRTGIALVSAQILAAVLLSAGTGPTPAWAQKGLKKKVDENGISPPPTDVNLLSMEVNALRTLYLLRGDDPDHAVGSQNPDERLTVIKFKKWVACAQKEDKDRQPAEVSDAYRKLLIELRAAYISQQDEKIEKLDKQLQDLREEEEPDLSDGVEITDEARRQAGAFVRLHCSSDQVVGYLASYGKDLPNPRTLLCNAMRVRGGRKGGTFGAKPPPDDWKTIREFTIREVSWQIGGVNVNKGETAAARIGELLDKAYAMSEEDLKANATNLAWEARAIADKVGPTDLIRHVIERDIAELLSNPRLVPAADARLKYLAFKKKQ